MAWENQLLVLGQLESSGDVSDDQYKAVQFSTTNGDNGMILTATRGGTVDGVLQGNSTTATSLGVMVYGVSKVVAGDSSAMENAISFGTRLVASSQGHAVPSTGAGQHLIGISLGTLSTGSTGIIPVLLAIGSIST